MAVIKNSNENNAVWHTIVWNQKKKDPDLPYPNLAVYNKETKETEYLKGKGERGGFNVTGKIVYVGLDQRTSFRDREQETGEKSLYNLNVIFKDENGNEDALVTPVISDGKPYRPATYFVSQLAKLLHENKDAYINLGVYRKKDSDFTASSINIATGFNEDGSPIFNASTNDNRVFVEKESPFSPPVPQDRVDDKGNKILDNDNNPLKDFGPLLAWTAEVVKDMVNLYKDNEKQSDYQAQAAEAADVLPDDDSLDMDDVAKEIAQENKARMR